MVTFLMVFLIQNTRKRDGAAGQIKLDEIIRHCRAQTMPFWTWRSCPIATWRHPKRLRELARRARASK